MAKRRSSKAALPGDALVDALVQTAFVIIARLTKLGAEHDLSLTQLRVYGILRDRRLRMAALADYLGLEKSTMTGLIDRAEKKGIVTRAPSAEDGRAIEVFLTEDGKELVERFYPKVVETLAPLTERLESRDQRSLQGLLRQMLDSPDE
jgi:DNA-binding MarR family transcriptional regulator